MPPRPRFGDDPAERLLIDCVRWPRTSAGIDAIRSAARSVDWPRLTALVARHRVAALTIDALDAAGVQPPEPLKAVGRKATRVSLAATAEAIRLSALLNQAGIAVAVLKGPVVSQRYFGQPTLRDYHDLDLLIDPAQLRAALALLNAEGYRQLNGPPHDARPALTAYWQEGHKDVALVHDMRRVMIELHYRLWNNPYAMAPLSIDDARANVVIGAASLRCFDDRLSFAYLAAHGAAHRFIRLKWLVDIRAIQATTSADELRQLLESAERAGAGAAARLALALSAQLFGDTLPPAVKSAVAADARIERKLQACMRALAGGEAPPTGFATLAASWRELTLSAAPGYLRWQLTTRLRDWRVAARLPLPRALHALYLPLALARWFATKIGETVQQIVAARRRHPRP